MAIQTGSLASLEHDWYATRSGLSSNARLNEHKLAYYASRGIGDENFTVVYRGDVLPDADSSAWTKTGDATTIENSPAGFLHIVSSDEGIGYEIEDTVSDTTGATIETRLKIIAGETRDYPGDSVNSYVGLSIVTDAAAPIVQLMLYSDGIVLYEGEDYYDMDTTDDYHVYRLTTIGGTTKVYVDGVLRITSTGAYHGSGAEGFKFQPEDTAVEDMETSWDYVNYRTDGAFAPGEGLVNKPLTQREEEWLLSVSGRSCDGLYDLWSGACEAQSVTVGGSVDECKFNFFNTITAGTNP